MPRQKPERQHSWQYVKHAQLHSDLLHVWKYVKHAQLYSDLLHAWQYVKHEVTC